MSKAPKITSKKSLEEKINEYLELQSQIEELEARAEEIKDSIKEYMGDKEEILTDDHKVRWTTVVSNRFDTTSFKTSHPKLYKGFLKESVSRRFSVS